MISTLYRKIVSPKFRKKIYDLFLSDCMWYFRTMNPRLKGKFAYYFKGLIPDKEINEAYAFIGKYGVTDYPFDASLKYQTLKTNILLDKEIDLLYIYHNGRKLYFPRCYTKERIITLYKSLRIEQDENSPHKYVVEYEEVKNKVLLDVGAAEGIFALDTIDLTKEVYLFEYEDFWQEPLEATFSPWKEKVHIVKKYVGDTDLGLNISLDTFCKGKDVSDYFIKMDIEGAEMQALRGAEQILMHSKPKVAICTYHRKDDANEISSFLVRLGYSIIFTRGYILWENSLRKVVVKAFKI